MAGWSRLGARARSGRPVTEQEQMGTMMIVILGGLGTTADAISDIVVRLDVIRGQTRMCYGLGPHYSIGVPLAKLMIQVAFAELLARITHLQRDASAPLDRRDRLSRPYRELHITFEVR
jgi:cytochrome P450